MLQRGVQLLVDDLVGLGKVLPPLGVANQRKRAAHRLELAQRGLAGVSALLGKVDILRSNQDIASLGGCDHRRQQHRRGKEGDLVARVAGNER